MFISSVTTAFNTINFFISFVVLDRYVLIASHVSEFIGLISCLVLKLVFDQDDKLIKIISVILIFGPTSSILGAKFSYSPKIFDVE